MTFQIILAVWLVPILVYFWIGWIKLPKDSTLGDLIYLFNYDCSCLFPPVICVLIPLVNVVCLIITLGTMILDWMSNCKIK